MASSVHGEEGQHPEPPRAALQGSGTATWSATSQGSRRSVWAARTRSPGSEPTRSRRSRYSSPPTSTARRCANKTVKVLLDYANDRLRRPGEVPADGAQPDRPRLEGRVHGRRSVRPRRARRRQGRGVWGVGVDEDQSFLGTHMLTSAAKQVDVSVYDTIKAPEDEDEVQGRATTSSTAQERRRRLRPDQQEAAGRGTRAVHASSKVLIAKIKSGKIKPPVK